MQRDLNTVSQSQKKRVSIRVMNILIQHKQWDHKRWVILLWVTQWVSSGQDTTLSKWEACL